MDVASRKRSAAQGWLSRASNACVKGFDSVEGLESIEYECLIETFNKRLSVWDDVQNEYEQYVDIEDLNNEITKAAEFREKCQEPVLKLRTAWLKLNKQSLESVTVSQNSDVGESQTKMKLPKLELPKFSGEVTEFTTFMQQFNACVDTQNYPDIVKFNYLIGSLKGEAKHVLEGFPITEENCKEAKQVLEKRYGRPEVVVFSHIQSLLTLDAPEMDDVKSLSRFRDKLVAHVRALKVHNITSKNFGVILTPMTVSRLSDTLRAEWSRESEGKEADLDYLLTFLDKEVSRQERCASFSTTEPRASGPANSSFRPRNRRNASGVALYNNMNSSKSRNSCDFCGGPHWTAKCYEYLRLSSKDRHRRVLDAQLCFVCLSDRHQARNCRKDCDFCGGRHHITLCFQANGVNMVGEQGERNRYDTFSSHGSGEHGTSKNGKKESTSSEAVVLTSSLSGGSVSLLPTAKVRVKGSDDSWHVVTLLFDSGSDKSYVSSDLVRRVQPNYVKSVKSDFLTFGGRKNVSRSRVFELCVRDRNSETERSLQLTEVPVICLPLSNPRVHCSVLQDFAHLQLGEDFSETEDKFMSIDILIGQDFFWSLMLEGIYRAESGLVAQESLFGWVLSGSSSDHDKVSNGGVSLLNVIDVPDHVVKTFWDLESIGVREGEIEKDPNLEKFNETVTKTDSGRYRVGLLWKDEPPSLWNNERSAHRMLDKLDRKLENDQELKGKYNQVLKEMEEKGYIVEVCESGSDKIFYLPHRPHVRESSSSTKVRPVFNASFSGSNGVSLNDCLEQGPNLNPNVSEVLLRFRRWKFAVSADVQKAFLQIELDEKDQDVHRFLWRGDDGRTRKLKFVRVTFGINCSPFLLSATIRYHLSLFPSSQVIQELSENMYVDDFLSGADTEEETQELFVQAKRVMAEAGMNLTKWSSNDSSIIDEVNMDGQHSQKVLGLTWDQTRDCFTFVGIELPKIEMLRYSKRVVLSLMARVFDPLGFILPFTVSARFLFQDIWRLGATWDEDLPVECKESFRKWLTSLEILKGIAIPRQFLGHTWSEISSNMELHAFGDASLKGYGACVYLRYRRPDGGYESTLVRSCARVAPLERKTLPRLELLGALVTARLVSSVVKDLKLSSSLTYTCWTDSMVALGWIRSRPAKWKPWVANRVAQIQSLTNPERWRHVSGVENPADLVTRGIDADRLLESKLWWQGPRVLQSNHDFVSEQIKQSESTVLSVEETTLVEVEKRATVCLVTSEIPQMFDFEKWSTLNKVYRILGIVLKFVGCLMKRAGKRPCYSQKVKDTFVRIIQRQHFQKEFYALESGNKVSKDSNVSKFAPFVDNEGLLRVGGRIQLSELAYESKHPLILPKCHGSMLLIRFVHFAKNHAGVDSMITCLKANFEILGLRRIAKGVKRGCVSCKRFDARACNEQTGPLPRVRVTKAPVFTVTGIDFAGPVFCLDCPGQKFYICLFVCGVVRAIHLELVESLTSNDFVLAFRRFAALRRVPSIVYSDNGKNFVGGQRTLSAYLGPYAPDWRFICPRSPWWGGWWERLVRTFKGAVRKTIGRECLTKVELQTCLCEVAASVNSRPLTFVGTDIENKPPLTPNHFLAGQGSQGLESNVDEDPQNVSVDSLCLREQEMIQRQEDFWKIWSLDYLRNLPQSYQKFRKQGNLNIGSVVLIKEDNLPRMKWALGLVEKLHVGKDGIPRSVDLKTSKGRKTRSVQRLYNLEIANCDLSKVPKDGDENEVMDLNLDETIESVGDGGVQKDVCVGDGGVGDERLKDVSVRDGGVGDERLKDGSVRDGGVGDGRLKDGSVGDGGVGDGRLKDGSVGDGRLKDGGVGDGRLKDGSVRDGCAQKDELKRRRKMPMKYDDFLCYK